MTIPAISGSVSASIPNDGSLDTTFGTNGITNTDIGRGDFDSANVVAVQSDGKILVAGNSQISGTLDVTVVRYNTDGTPDNTFGINGKTTIDVGDEDVYTQFVALQGDGKIVFVGTTGDNPSDLAIMRFNANGTPDISFSGDGKATTDLGGHELPYSVAFQSDGKIIVAGTTSVDNVEDFAIVRYNTDGTLDNSFSGDGKATTNIGTHDYARSVAVQSDGKIVVAGESRIGEQYDVAVVRYNTDGTLDNSFSGDGKATTSINDSDDRASQVVIHENQNERKIIVAGNSHTNGYFDFGVVRYNTDGTLDNSFSGDGIVTTDFDNGSDEAYSIAVHTNGKILVAGEAEINGQADFGVVRYNTDGTLDNTFGTNGKTSTNVGTRTSTDDARSVVLQSDGKILVVGESGSHGNTNFTVVRYNSNGTLDNTFGANGKVTTKIGQENDATSVAVHESQEGRRIIVVGRSVVGGHGDFVVMRYNDDGSLDTSFGGDGIVSTNIGNRASDNTSPSDDYAQSVVVQSNGKILVAGHADVGSSPEGGANDFVVVRFNTDGALDGTFGNSGKVTTNIDQDNNEACSVELQSDGKILVAGHSFIGDSWDITVVRYTINGTLDPSFSDDGIVTTNFSNSVRSEFAYSAAVQPDGKIVIAGKHYGPSWDQIAVLRYNTDGTLDSTFDEDGIVTINIMNTDSAAYSVAVQSNGKILVAGHSYIDYSWDFTLVRFNTNGTLDSTFDEDGIVTTNFQDRRDTGRALAIQPDGKVIVGGQTGEGLIADFGILRYNSTPPAGYPSPTTSTTTIVPASRTAPTATTPAQVAPSRTVINALPLASPPLVATNSFTPGQSLSLTLGGFTPNELVQLVVASTPQIIGTGYANATGVVTLTGELPNNLSAGRHTLAVYAPDSKKGFRQAITVSASVLPATGLSNNTLRLMVAMNFIVFGLGLVLVRHRLRKPKRRLSYQ